MKIREDYEYTGWRRLVHWVNGDQLEKPVELYSRDNIKSDEEVAFNRRNRLSKFTKKVKTYVRKNSEVWYNNFYRIMSILVAVAIISVLLATVTQLPEFGNPNNPANNPNASGICHCVLPSQEMIRY